MFDAIATTATEMAAAAILASRFADLLGDPGEIGRLEQLLARRAFHRLEFAILVQRVSGIGAEFLVGAGVVVTGQAVNVVLVCEIKILVFPAVTGVATGAPGLVRGDRTTEIIGRVAFAQLLAGGRACGLPLPVNALHYLMARLVVAAQTDFGDFRPAGKRPFECLQFAVIGSRFTVLGAAGDSSGVRRICLRSECDSRP